VHGLTGARLAVLAHLMAEGPLSLTSLAAAERVSMATMARIVDGLQEGKLVIKRRSSEDGRVVQVVPTALGTSLALGAEGRRLRWLETFLNRLNERDRATIERAVAILGPVVGEGAWPASTSSSSSGTQDRP
jgi:DNA-binding MarR family transcriptional regulator